MAAGDLGSMKGGERRAFASQFCRNTIMDLLRRNQGVY